MKVVAVRPGSVSFSRGDNEWICGYYLHHSSKRKTFVLVTGFESAHAAKQGMRERIAQERKLHSLGEST